MINKIQKLFAVTETGARGVIKATFTSMMMHFAYIAPIFLVMIFVQNFLAQQRQSPLFFAAGIIVLGLVMYALIYVNYDTLYTETYKESANLRIDIANTLKSLPLSYFSKHDISDLSQTVMADVAAIEHGLSHSIPQMIGLILYLTVIAGLMFAFHPALGLCVFAPIIISIFLVFLSRKMQIHATTKHYGKMRERSESFQEAIELQQEIKSCAKAEQTARNLCQTAQETEKIHVKTEFMQAGPLQISLLILRFSIGFTVFFGLKLYLNGSASLLYLIGYVIAAARIIDAAAGVEANIAEIMYLNARFKRINELRGTRTQKGEKARVSSYDITFKNVEFSYNKEQKVIDGISFTAEQNRVTALVGPSGCGKTSVLRLASRLYDYDKGQILIGGKEIKNIDTDSLFEKISIVFQDVMLFNASIMENIRIGNRNAGDEEVKEAARLANCTEFIEALPDGYNTLIGENGSKLSGGERQRISIARAILKNAPIIILDEISASLDVENEKSIQKSLNALIKDKTVIIISHRLRSIEKADKIIVLNQGKIDAQGKHGELMQKSALYRSMIEKSAAAEKWKY